MRSIRTPLLLIIIIVLAVLLFLQYRKNQNQVISYNYNADSAQVHHISEQEAIKLTTSFRRGRIELTEQLKNPAYLNTNFNLPFAEKFNRDAIAILLNQKGAKGLRIYLARDYRGRNKPVGNYDTLRIRLVLVAVDSKGHDLVNASARMGSLGSAKVSYVVLYQDGSGNDGQITENGQLCPTICDPNSPLYH